jgi:tetratricopeptide (TPR) repeat protein
MTDHPSAETRPAEASLAQLLQRLWEQGQQPDPAGLLRAAGNLPASEIAAVLAVDQWHRWHAGQRIPVEDYLRRFPALAADSEAALELAYGELLVREALGDSADLAEYLARFPQFADRLRQQVELHRALGDTTAGSGASMPASPSTTGSDGAPAWPGRALPGVPGYEILGELGRGGMGVVYQARDLCLQRLVALKMVLAAAHVTAERLARFRGEAEAIARLQHPNVVQIYEVGEHEGLPFFAMEHVPGGTLERRLGGIPHPAPGAAVLVEHLARAVQAAHECGVIHRDLKPANVLLASDGTPKIADFGLAKRLGDSGPRTASGAILGTPNYMAPEQAMGQRAEAGPAADIYSLGTILYEALTGRPPFLGITVHDTLLQVVRQEPVPPRRLNPAVPRDLETVCLHCLHKQPERRYASAGALADDLARFRRGEPVAARPVGTVERGWRWCRRNPAIAALAAAVLVALLAGTVVSWRFAVQADARAEQERLARQRADSQTALAQRNLKRALAAEGRATQKAELAALRQQEAQEQRAVAEAVNNFLQTDLLLQADSVHQARSGFVLDPNLTVKEALQRAAQKIGTQFPNRPLVEAGIRQALGDAYRGIGQARQALPHLEKALALRMLKLGRAHPDTLNSMTSLAIADLSAGRMEQSVELFEEVLARSRASLGPNHPRTIGRMVSLGAAYKRTRGVEPALPLLEETVKRARAVLGPDHPNTLIAMNNLADSWASVGRFKESRELLEEAVKLAKGKLGPDHPDTLGLVNSLAVAWAAAGRRAEAETLLTDAVERARTRLGPDHPDTLLTRNNLADLWAAGGRTGEAIQALEDVLTRARARWGSDNPSLVIPMDSLVRAYEKAGRIEAALRLHEETLKLSQAQLGAGHPMTLDTMDHLAGQLWRAEKRPRAIEILEQTVALRKAHQGPSHRQTLASALSLARAYRDTGRLARAVELASEVLPLCRKHLGPEHPSTLMGIGVLAFAFDLQRDHARAAPLYRELMGLYKKTYGPRHSRTSNLTATVTLNLLRLKLYAEAEPLLRELVTICEEVQPDQWGTYNLKGMLGESLLGQKKYAEAEPVLRAAYEGISQRLARVPPGGKPRLLEVGQCLVQLYEAWGRPEQAEVWRQTLARARKSTPAPMTPEKKGMD